MTAGDGLASAIDESLHSSDSARSNYFQRLLGFPADFERGCPSGGRPPGLPSRKTPVTPARTTRYLPGIKLGIRKLPSADTPREEGAFVVSSIKTNKQIGHHLHIAFDLNRTGHRYRLFEYDCYLKRRPPQTSMVLRTR